MLCRQFGSLMRQVQQERLTLRRYVGNISAKTKHTETRMGSCRTAHQRPRKTISARSREITLM